MRNKDLISAIKADNLSNENQGVGLTAVGIAPKPLRKKGYYRALRRKEPWALNKACFDYALDTINDAMYCLKIESMDIVGLKKLLSASEED